eukprot:jgi/Pico_ML_1/54508/g4845.t2
MSESFPSSLIIMFEVCFGFAAGTLSWMAKRTHAIDEEGMGDEGDLMELMPLGAGQEVGRSCMCLKYKGKTVMKTTFKGRVFMTHSTKAIYRLLVSDYVKISKVAVEDMLFDEHDLNSTMDKIEVIDYHQQVEVDGIRFWGYVAGIRAQYQVSNPFMFKHIQSLKGMSDFDDIGPSVVMASPGYSVEGTLAKHILSEPKEVTLMSGQSVPLKMAVHYISFSAHADYTQTSEFLDIIQCPNIVLVHGEANEMGRLKAALQHKFESAGKKVQVLNPKNCQTVQMHFKTEKVAKAVGSFAQESPKEGDKISGLLVKKGFVQHLMKPSDLDDYTQLSTISITQKQSLPFHHSFESLEKRLKRMYDDADTLKALLYSIFGDVEQEEGSPVLTVRLNSKHAEVVLETKEVISEDEELKERIEKAIQRIERAMFPLSCCC